jgi:hypothetical protein
MWLGRLFPLPRLLHGTHTHPCDSIELIFSGRMLAPPNKLEWVLLELKGS